MIDNLDSGQRKDQFQLALESELVRAKQYLGDRQNLGAETSGRIAGRIP